MASRKVTEIHLVCRKGTHVENRFEAGFDSGWWKISPKHVRQGVVFALHQSKDEPSYLQGTVERLLSQGERGREGRVLVRVASSRDPLPWRGGGSGERGYCWDGLDFSDLDQVPIALGDRDVGANRGVKSLLEAEEWTRPLWNELKGVRKGGAVGATSPRQAAFKRVVDDLAATMEGGPIPFAFFDMDGLPFRLDDGCVAMAINAGMLEDETRSKAGQPVLCVTVRESYLRINRDYLAARKAVLQRRAAGPGDDAPDERRGQDLAVTDPFEGLDLSGVAADEFRRATVRARVGQADFRAAVLLAYGGRCTVTGTTVEATLEAAHIVPYSLAGAKGMDRRNGILLRADIHGLFDAHLLGLRPDAAGGPPTVVVAEALRGTEYEALDGTTVASPADSSAAPSRTAVSLRWSKSGLEWAAELEVG